MVIRQLKKSSGLGWHSCNISTAASVQRVFSTGVSSRWTQRAETFFMFKMSCKMLKTYPWLIFTFSTIASTVIRRSLITRASTPLAIPSSSQRDGLPLRSLSSRLVWPHWEHLHHLTTVSHDGALLPHFHQLSMGFPFKCRKQITARYSTLSMGYAISFWLLKWYATVLLSSSSLSPSRSIGHPQSASSESYSEPTSSSLPMSFRQSRVKIISRHRRIHPALCFTLTNKNYLRHVGY